MSNHQNLLFSRPEGYVWARLKGRHVLVAFSGGKDSLALINYMYEHRAFGGWRLTACHVNHHLRAEESDRDENFCREYCAERGIDFVAVAVDVDSSTRGMEFAARQVRYDALTKAADDCGADYIVTGHTSSDQLESFFVDLLTGASIYTLGGISCGAGKFLRPILDISTEMVNVYLNRKGLSAVFDSSNSDLRYERNFVRSEVLPVFTDRLSKLEASVLRIQRESREIDEWLDARTAHFVSFPAEGGAVIARKFFDAAHDVEKSYIIGKWISRFARGGKVHIDAIMEQAGRERSARIDLPEHYICEVTPRNLRIFHKALVAPFEIKAVDYEGGKLPPELVREGVILRSRINGDRYKGKKLKDLFEARKLDPYDRDRALVAVEGDEIIWVEFLDERA